MGCIQAALEPLFPGRKRGLKPPRDGADILELLEPRASRVDAAISRLVHLPGAVHELEEAVESFENATYLENLDGVPQMRVVDLNQRVGVRLTSLPPAFPR